MLKTTLIEAAKAGAAEIVRFFNSDFKISNKEGVNNLVTEADHAAEKAILSVIKSQLPLQFLLHAQFRLKHNLTEYRGQNLQYHQSGQ